MEQFINLVRIQINLKGLFSYGNTLILCISGGQDSNLLYLIFTVLKYQYNLPLVLVYCNHYWQKDSVLNQQNLTQLVYLNKHPIIFCTPFFLVKQGEFNAAFWRYTSLQRICFFVNADLVLTGHTSTDVVESFLFYLIRGSQSRLITQFQNITLNEYSKLYFFTVKKTTLSKLIDSRLNIIINTSANLLKVIKPIQNLTRYEVYHLINFFYFPIWVDQTNFSMRYARNRIRYQLLPLIRFYFNPKTDINVHRFLNTLFDDITFLDYLTLKLKDLNNITKQTNFFSYTFAFFFSCPYIFQKRLLVEGFNQIKVPQFNYKNLELILKFLYIQFYKPELRKKPIILIINKKIKVVVNYSVFYFYSL
jgi:tRNA(Ile)-lysidine synthase